MAAISAGAWSPARAFGHTDSAVIARAIHSKRTAVISIEKGGHANVAF
jgi:hypothetical protein